MEILQLKYFCDAAQTENFSKTAKKFIVPPSNISQTIKRLEAELETPLFNRQSNKIKLNESGLFFYKNAKSALDLLENAKSVLKSPSISNTIKIYIHITRRVVMEAIESFRKTYPDISFITVHSTEEITEDFDIIVTDKDFDTPHLKTKITEENFLLAYNKNKFQLNSNFSSSQIKKLPFITMGAGSSIYEHTLKICNNYGFTPHIVLQSEDPFYIRQCIELGLGVSVVPQLSWFGQFSDNITLQNIGENKRNIYIYKKNSMNHITDKFYETLIEKFSL